MDESTRNPAERPLPAHAADSAPFRLGGWLIEPTLNRITRQDDTETIEPRMMHVLVCLAAVPGQVVSRRDLLDVVWGEVVVGEEVLTRAVSRLRLMLGDDRSSPRYFETIRGGGYRLLLAPEPVNEPVGASGRPRPRRVLPWLYPALAVAVVLLAVVTVVLLRRPAPEPPLDLQVAVPVTTLGGNEAFPALAPDGVNLVFSWTGGDEDPGLFLKQIGNEEVLRLTRPEGRDTRAVFSPDGATLAFVRTTRDGRSLRLVPATGGATRLLTETSSRVFGLDWSPDGQHLVYAAVDSTSGQSCLLRLDVATLEVTALTTVNTETHIGDSWPVFAPDGETIAFARCDHAGLREIWLVPATGGEGRPVTRGLNDCQGLSWLPGGDALVVSSPILGKTGLWHVRLADGRISPLPLIAQGQNTHPALTADGSVLVFRNLQRDYNLTRLVLPAGDDGVELLEFTPSTRNEFFPAWSPDASRVAFVSDRSGENGLWLATGDGTSPRLVKAWPEVEISDLYWAPDGRRVAANLMDADGAWIEIVDTETGLTRPLGEATVHERFCGWLAETGWISLLRDEGQAWQLYRMREDGSEAARLDLALAGHPTVQAIDQGYLFIDPEKGGLWSMEHDGSSRRQIITADTMSAWRAMHYLSADLYVLTVTPERRVQIEIIDLADGASRLIAEAPERAVDLSVAPGGAQVLLTILAEVRSDLMMVHDPTASIR